ncbi:MAG: DUF4442 domain-containing protein [Aureispira sp.]
MNRLSKIVKNIYQLPPFIQPFALSLTLGNVVKFIGTAGIRFEKMQAEEVIVTLANKRKVQNHIGQVHAAATALLAETATGMVVGMNVPDDKIPLLKSMQVTYLKRSQGQQHAVASLDAAQIEHLKTAEKGDVTVPVIVKDSVGTQVVEVEMVWAWIPKRR